VGACPLCSAPSPAQGVDFGVAVCMTRIGADGARKKVEERRSRSRRTPSQRLSWRSRGRTMRLRRGGAWRGEEASSHTKGGPPRSASSWASEFNQSRDPARVGPVPGTGRASHRPANRPTSGEQRLAPVLAPAHHLAALQRMAVQTLQGTPPVTPTAPQLTPPQKRSDLGPEAGRRETGRRGTAPGGPQAAVLRSGRRAPGAAPGCSPLGVRTARRCAARHTFVERTKSARAQGRNPARALCAKSTARAGPHGRAGTPPPPPPAGDSRRGGGGQNFNQS
jgi:hypothetical protein